MLWSDIRENHRLAGDLVGPASVVPERRGRGGNVARDSVGVQLAHLRGLECRQFGGVLFDEICRTGEDTATLGTGHPRPRARVERVAGSVDSGIDVIGPTACDLATTSSVAGLIDENLSPDRAGTARPPMRRSVSGTTTGAGVTGAAMSVMKGSYFEGGVKRRSSPDHDES